MRESGVEKRLISVIKSMYDGAMTVQSKLVQVKARNFQ